MERWQNRASKSPQCPSFSSSLLDSIYRSIDNERHAGGAPDPLPPRNKQAEITRPSRDRERWTRINHPCSAKRRPAAATSSSSDGSSYSGFSSSESEPASTREKRSKKERLGSRFLRELRKGRDPVSPGARLANFINSLFAVKSKGSSNGVSGVEGSRSCMTKTPSLRGKSAEKRSVRFCPISVIVDEDCRPCGHKCVYAEERPAAARGRSAAEMFRGLGVDEDGDAGSDSSSDLFELENLGVAGGFRDELPVYETTRFESYGGISRGLLL